MAPTKGPVAGLRHPHGHMWIIGLAGIAAGVVLLVYVPTLKAVSASILLFAGFHIVGGLVLAASLYVVGLRGWLRRLRRRGPGRQALDFGWGPGWMNGLAIAALVVFAGAVALQVARPDLWPIAFLLVVQGVLFLVGNSVMSAFRRLDHMVLPMVDLIRGGADRVLDAGCGAGRTSIALSRVLRQGGIVAIDRFDAEYIDDGGRALLDRNLAIAGLTDRVEVVTGDLTAMPFEDASFDAAVSTNVYDHLGKGKAAALGEIRRVLKPGGRFLMVVWTPGLTMFTVGHLLSLLLTSKAGWRAMARRAGLTTVDEGMINNVWFAVFERPAVA